MANYTESIRERIQQNMQPGDSWENPEAILRIVKDAVLPAGALLVISDEYRDRFALGFAYHFLNEEIGLETWPLWRLACAGRIYNNAEYINKLYALAAKEGIFSRIHRRTGTGTTTQAATTEANNTQDATTATVNGSSSKSQQDTGDTADRWTTSKDDTTTSTTGSDNSTVTGTRGETTTGTDNGTENSTSTDKNDHLFSDTPQNGLDPVRTGKYLTNATIDDGTTTAGRTTENATSRTTDANDSQETKRGTSSEGTLGTTREGHDSSTTTGFTDTSTTGESTSNGTTHSDGKATTDMNSTINREDADEDYDLVYAEVIKAEPIVGRVWSLFQDIFMLIL